MIPIILSVAIALFVAVMISEDRYRGRNWGEFFTMFLVLAFAFIAIFSIFISVMGRPIPLFPNGNYVIKGMQDTSVLEEHFVLGSGSIGSDPVYICYIKDVDSDTSYRQYRITAEPQYSRVEEENITQPYLEVRTEVVGSFWWTLVEGTKLEEYVFHVPLGTIIKEVTLDAKD